MTTKEELKVQVIGYAQELEELANGDYEEMAEYLEGVYDVKITIDGNFNYDSVTIALAVGGPGIVFDTETSEVRGRWGYDEFSWAVKSFAVDAVDNYFQNYYEECR